MFSDRGRTFHRRRLRSSSSFLVAILLAVIASSFVDATNICRNGVTRNVGTEGLKEARKRGDKIGRCNQFPGRVVRLCHNPGEENKETKLLSHDQAFQHMINHSRDFLGPCVPVRGNEDRIRRKIGDRVRDDDRWWYDDDWWRRRRPTRRPIGTRTGRSGKILKSNCLCVFLCTGQEVNCSTLRRSGLVIV